MSQMATHRAHSSLHNVQVAARPHRRASCWCSCTMAPSAPPGWHRLRWATAAAALSICENVCAAHGKHLMLCLGLVQQHCGAKAHPSVTHMRWGSVYTGGPGDAVTCSQDKSQQVVLHCPRSPPSIHPTMLRRPGQSWTHGSACPLTSRQPQPSRATRATCTFMAQCPCGPRLQMRRNLPRQLPQRLCCQVSASATACTKPCSSVSKLQKHRNLPGSFLSRYGHFAQWDQQHRQSLF